MDQNESAEILFWLAIVLFTLALGLTVWKYREVVTNWIRKWNVPVPATLHMNNVKATNEESAVLTNSLSRNTSSVADYSDPPAAPQATSSIPNPSPRGFNHRFDNVAVKKDASHVQTRTFYQPQDLGVDTGRRRVFMTNKGPRVYAVNEADMPLPFNSIAASDVNVVVTETPGPDVAA